MAKLRILSLALAVLLLAGMAGATIRWVDCTNTTPPYNGTLTDPFRHPSQVKDSLAIGDTVRIKTGTYPMYYGRTDSTRLHIFLPGSSSNSAFTVIQGYTPNAGDTVFLRMADGDSGSVIWVDSTCWNLVIENLHILNATTPCSTEAHPAGIRLSGHTTVVRDCRVYGCSIGIFLRPPDIETWDGSNKIYYNVISQTGEAGIRVKGTNNNSIFANLIYDVGQIWGERAGAITMYWSDSTWIYNNTFVTGSTNPALHLYRGTDAGATPAQYCRIFDNIGVTTYQGYNTTFAADSTYAHDTTNYIYGNTWYDTGDDTTWFAWGASSWGYEPRITFAQYLDSLPDNLYNGLGERNRNPRLEMSRDSTYCYELLGNSPEINAGSRLASEASLSNATAVVAQTLDADTVDRGYHSRRWVPTLNPDWSGPYAALAVGSGKNLTPGKTASGPQTTTLELSAPLQIKQAILYNILGQQVAILKSSEIGRLVAEVYTLNLPNGFYLLKMDTNAGLKVMKLPHMR